MQLVLALAGVERHLEVVDEEECGVSMLVHACEQVAGRRTLETFPALGLHLHRIGLVPGGDHLAVARGERRQRLGRQLALAPFTGVVDRLLDLTEEGTHLDRSVSPAGSVG